MEEDLVQYIRINAHLMKKNYNDEGVTISTLIYSSKMLQILRHDYQPRKYYDAYTQVVQELSHLALDLMDCSDEKITYFYDQVQLDAFAVPRMYMLILMGSIAIKKKVDTLVTIVQDIHEMCRCVQHPIRGMFVRYYLITTLKSLIPNSRDECDDPDNYDELVHFVLQNFTEMNKLWVRMQYLAAPEDKKRIETERSELKILLASNLVKLSEMCADDIEFYEKSVLKIIMKDIIVSNDPFAEEFLFECILNIFPESFHANKLNSMIEMLSSLNEKVDFGRCFRLLCERVQLRITTLIADNKKEKAGQLLLNLLKSLEIFDIKGAEKISMSTRLLFYTSLLTTVIKTFPERLDYLDMLLSQIIKGVDVSEITPDINDDIYHLLNSVVDNSTDLNVMVSIPNFIPLFQILIHKTSLSCHIIDKSIEQGIKLKNSSEVSNMATIALPILTEKYDADDIAGAEESWGRVCLLIRLIMSNEPSEKLDLFKILKQKLFQNVHAPALRIVIHTLIVELVELMDQKHFEGSTPSNTSKTSYDFHMKELTQFIFNCSKLLTTPDDSDIAIELFMLSSIVMDKYNFESKNEITNEFLSKVFTYYEEDILDNKTQLTQLKSIISSIYKMKHLSEENRNCYYQRCVQLALKLLKKQDQCSVTLQAIKLYYVPSNEDFQKKISNLLVRLEKIISQCMDDDVRIECYIDILESYIYYYSLSCSNINIDNIRSLYEKIKSDVHLITGNKSELSLTNRFDGVCNFIQRNHPTLWSSLDSS